MLASLESQSISGTIPEHQPADYSLKIRLEAGGNVIISYSPKKQRCTMHLENIADSGLRAIIEKCYSMLSKDVGALTGDANSGIATGTMIYVDGSWVVGVTAYAFLILQNGNLVNEKAGIVETVKAGSSRQVAGELQAVLEALAWCRENNVPDVSIHYDYEGIEKWITGAWKAKTPLTTEYIREVGEVGITIRWIKVEAHSGDRWNERVDELARQAAVSNVSGANLNLTRPNLNELGLRLLEILHRNSYAGKISRVRTEGHGHIQIEVSHSDASIGHLNLYADASGHLSARFHEILSRPDRLALEVLWRNSNRSPSDTCSRIDFYYEALRPFRHLKLDFQVLAQVLAAEWIGTFGGTADIESRSLDFEFLEKCRADLARFRHIKKVAD